MRLVRIIVFALCYCGLCWGQATDQCRPSSLNVPGAKYPCVYPDGRAMFRVVAPDAQKVQVRVGRAFDMEKGPDGAWTATTTPLVVGFHYYSLVIDGATDAAAFNKKVKVLFLGIGSVEGPNTKNFSDQLTKAGIKNVYFESPGTAHEWLTWRRCLNDFAPLLFK